MSGMREHQIVQAEVRGNAEVETERGEICTDEAGSLVGSDEQRQRRKNR